MKLCLFLPAKPDQKWLPARQMGVRFAIAKLFANGYIKGILDALQIPCE